MFFVLSSGRSGSKTISAALDQFPNCTCLHHPEPELVVEATEFLYGEADRREIAETLRTTRSPHIDGSIYGEVNLQHTLLFPILREVFPEAQYVWLIRDGRDAVASMYYRGWYDPDHTNVAEYWHRARLDGSKTGDFGAEEWEQFTRFEKCCWIWRKYNELIEQQLGGVDETVWRKVRLESLKSSLSELGNFLGLTPPKKFLVEKKNTAMQPVVAWQSWNDDQRRQFEGMCAGVMDRWYPVWRDDSGKWKVLQAEAPDAPPISLRAKRFGKKVFRRLKSIIRK